MKGLSRYTLAVMRDPLINSAPPFSSLGIWILWLKNVCPAFQRTLKRDLNHGTRVCEMFWQLWPNTFNCRVIVLTHTRKSTPLTLTWWLSPHHDACLLFVRLQFMAAFGSSWDGRCVNSSVCEHFLCTGKKLVMHSPHLWSPNDSTSLSNLTGNDTNVFTAGLFCSPHGSRGSSWNTRAWIKPLPLLEG